ncbi:S-adenosylmethionine:tRNA ribosyltransferase-isomerase [Kineosporia sp. J2-2]|uniref:S-adenosylmethionine:tRNA ribosyltransferase-isomerase n=1 Tax=Kineosporia corallincola TaxID=2835133 RepID=A0ABS5TRA2_9ACTN|nr:S-adenosylmethionine:tRNA ribosyltransferase-isomerase [Kineosporia corallincola]MBT0773079.1 S-adenosylmethionine:tRNA ribosyltransferase-isomerase [Kineosporia corallincola]
MIRPSTTFELPPGAEATGPPEARGLARDQVRLLVAGREALHDTRFDRIGDHLRPGDLLVVNTSATRAAAVDGEHARLGPVVVHLSTHLPDDAWVVEVRSAPDAAERVRDCAVGDEIRLSDGTLVNLLAGDGERLWTTQPLGTPPGRPIRYGYLSGRWPLESYQTVFADPLAPGASAEMPSAGRPFSTDLVTRLVSAGIRLAPIALHAGVSSLETGEAPPAEPYRVPESTAALVNWTRRTGGRVIAVGTTVTRALESATHPEGQVRPARGWTDLVISRERPVRVVDGLITGWHDPEASHLLMLEAVAGPGLVRDAYAHAVEHGYLWHEFGDSCLFLP